MCYRSIPPISSSWWHWGGHRDQKLRLLALLLEVHEMNAIMATQLSKYLLEGSDTTNSRCGFHGSLFNFYMLVLKLCIRYLA